MSSLANCFVWNVRGLNGRARRNVVREFVVQERPTLVCIQETKLSMICNALANKILGTAFDYVFLPTVNVSGGILLSWSVIALTVSDVARGRFTLSAKLSKIGMSSDPWWITVVYGPQLDNDKVQFLEELR